MVYHEKIRVGVLRGGPSSEYDISLKTGASVLRNLPERFEGIDVFIDREGRWHARGAPREPKRILGTIDVVFNALHGEFGEDGGVQQLLESFGVPYSGSGGFASRIAMSKPLAKEMLSRTGIKSPYHELLLRDAVTSVSRTGQALYRSFPQPSIIKPAGLGSSVGISLVSTARELEDALDEAFRVSEKVMIEEYVPGREAAVAVIDDFRGARRYTLPPIEIVPPPESRFFDYFAKYSGKSRHSCPGNFSRSDKEALQELALQVHSELGLRHYSQSDFVLHPRRGIYFLEVNALPGLTEHSLFPAALAAVGSSLSEFLEHVITRSLSS